MRARTRDGHRCAAQARLLVVCGLAWSCGQTVANGPAEDLAPTLTVEEARIVVPSAGLPAEVSPMDANNNLDIAWHNDRLFLAFRTAPDHFASEQTRLYVVSTADEDEWQYEGEFHLGTDLREPQLVSWDGQLHLFFAVLGSNPAAFEPQGSRRTTWLGSGNWTEPETVFEDTFIPWRIKEIGGELHLIGYTGGAGIYDPDSNPLEVIWRRSADAVTWVPAVEGSEVVHTGGGSETDVVVRTDGSVVAIMRNEAGDRDGHGSKLCTASADAPGDWTCVADPRKFDSPLLFEREGRVWLVGRRNLTEDGHYDLSRDDLDPLAESLMYQLEYWQAPKRCTVWAVDPELLTITAAVDLPSRGDTCFPEAVDLDGELLLYNYSSDPEGPDLSWVDGQKAPTFIVRQIVRGF